MLVKDVDRDRRREGPSRMEPHGREEEDIPRSQHSAKSLGLSEPMGEGG